MSASHHVTVHIPLHLKPLLSNNPLLIPYIKLQLHQQPVPNTADKSSSTRSEYFQIIISNQLYNLQVDFHDSFQGENEFLNKDALKMQIVFDADSGDASHSEHMEPTNGSTPLVTRKQPIPSLGALQKEMDFIRETISFSFTENSSIHGLLIYGLPGTGKTQLVNSVLMRDYPEVKRFSLKPTHFTSRQYGRNEHRLRDFFQRAKQEDRAFIICDEIDVCMLQQTESGERTETNRLMRALGSELEMLHSEFSHSSHKVIFIAITNRIEKIPSTLRRPGRLDRELELQIPTENDRYDIIRVIMHDLHYAIVEREVDFLVKRTHGFIGADLRTLCQLYVITQASQRTSSSDDDAKSLLIDTEKIEHVLAQVKPSAIRHVQIQIPNVKWTDIGGMNDVKQQLKESIEWQLTHRDAFERMGIRSPRGILLYGPPGCSKTMMAKALATECHMNFLSVRGPELFSKWVGESERAVKKLFERARAASPCIIFFDEIDGLAVERGSSNSNVGDRVLSQLLSELDGIKSLERVTLVAATNRPDLIDRALLRPGRIDRMVYVSPPDYESRLSILRIYMRKMQHSLSEEDIEGYAHLTEGYSGAELAALCKEGAYIALNEYMKSGADLSKISVHRSHLEEAKNRVHSRLSSEMISFYEDFHSKHQKKI